MVLKLLVCFHLKKVSKDQILLKEGEKSPYFFLVKDGEFEMLKRVKKDLRVDLDYRQFVNKDKFTEELTPNDILQKTLGFNVD